MFLNHLDIFSSSSFALDSTASFEIPLHSKHEEFLQNKITNLENEIVFLRKRVSKIEENDLESNITEIMRILEAHGLVSILQIFVVIRTVFKKQYFYRGLAFWITGGCKIVLRILLI